MSTNKRYHINYTFIRSPLMLGAFNIHQICDLACGADHEVTLHHQICHEITYIVSGSGLFYRNSVAFEVKAGDLFILSRGDTHTLRASKTDPFRFLCIGFTFNRNHTEFEKYAKIAAFFDQITSPLARDTQRVYAYLSGAIGEVARSGDNAPEMLEAFVRQAIIGTVRSFGQENASSATLHLPPVPTNPLIFKMIRYIEDHLEEGGNLGNMGQQLGYSYSYLSRLFSATMGSTLRQYYNRRRFEKAAELLSSRTVAAVAEELGFADAPTFCKAFKKHYKLSPGAFRKTIT